MANLLHVIRINFGRLDPDPDPGGQQMTHKKKKVQKFDVLKCWMFSFKGWRLLL
jgi:hypothetical protein